MLHVLPMHVLYSHLAGKYQKAATGLTGDSVETRHRVISRLRSAPEPIDVQCR